MKKKTSAGAQRSNGSPTITWEYAARIINRTRPMLAAFFTLSIKVKEPHDKPIILWEGWTGAVVENNLASIVTLLNLLCY